LLTKIGSHRSNKGRPVFSPVSSARKGLEIEMFDPRRLLSISSVYRSLQARLRSDSTVSRLTGEFLKIAPGQRVLDIGCGPADILAYLPEDIDYQGYDAESNYIATARKRYGERGSFAVRAVSPEAVDDIGTFDVVMSLAVLHHLTDAEADTLFASAAKVLRPGGRVITLDCAYVDGQNPIARLLASLDRGKHVRSPDGYLSLARRHFEQADATILHDLIAVPYTHCIIEARTPRHSADIPLRL
jgi:cyclopropane fatty-acyl-phospholipid synthase-like methyltransferase